MVMARTDAGSPVHRRPHPVRVLTPLRCVPQVRGAGGPRGGPGSRLFSTRETPPSGQSWDGPRGQLVSLCATHNAARARDGGSGVRSVRRNRGAPTGGRVRPPWDLKNTIFSEFLPLNYVICIFEVCFLKFFAVWED